ARLANAPFNSRDQLSQAQKTLSSNGFSNLLLQQRKAR
ncbi:SPOR domain-containing protein, partial [Pseudomonas aeruginosa]|nr:SPOR domain-containing protein [Pseudomonas aeruginosa]